MSEICEDCEAPTDNEQFGPFGDSMGFICENCAERRYVRWQEQLMEEHA